MKWFVALLTVCSFAVAEEAAPVPANPDKDPVVADARAKLKDVTDKLDAAKAKFTGLKTKLTLANNDLGKVRSDQAALQDQVRQARRGTSDIANYSQVSAELNHKEETLMRTVRDLERKLEPAEKDFDAAQADYDAVHKALTDALEPYHAARVEAEKKDAAANAKVIKLKDGRAFTVTTVIETDDSLTFKDTDGKFHTFKKSEIQDQ